MVCCWEFSFFGIWHRYLGSRRQNPLLLFKKKRKQNNKAMTIFGGYIYMTYMDYLNRYFYTSLVATRINQHFLYLLLGFSIKLKFSSILVCFLVALFFNLQSMRYYSQASIPPICYPCKCLS